MSNLGFLILEELKSEPNQKEKFDIAIDEGGNAFSRKRKEHDRQEMSTTWYYLSLVGEIGFSIAIPITVGVLIGSFIDRKIGTYPKWTVGLLVSGTILAILHMIRVVRTILKE